ncbi:hypothetical protein L1276_000979 [Flavobacterium sp. HSC-32F16]|nr:hypothetical protein [Flavobacterium sp. HSC-32F16]
MLLSLSLYAALPQLNFTMQFHVYIYSVVTKYYHVKEKKFLVI